jgi:hypothetical protein
MPVARPNTSDRIQDITTYKVSLRDGPGGQLDFEELLVGVGALCGSTFINHNFDKWMIRKFGDFYTRLEKNLRDFSSNFFSQFEDQKKGFSGPQHSRRIPVFPIQMAAPRSPSYDRRNCTVYLQPYFVTGRRHIQAANSR